MSIIRVPLKYSTLIRLLFICWYRLNSQQLQIYPRHRRPVGRIFFSDGRFAIFYSCAGCLSSALLLMHSWTSLIWILPPGRRGKCSAIVGYKKHSILYKDNNAISLYCYLCRFTRERARVCVCVREMSCSWKGIPAVLWGLKHVSDV